MKCSNFNKVLLGSSTLLALGAMGQAAHAATAGVNISAEILAPVQITATRTLNFGSVTENGAGGTVTVDNTDARSVGGGVTAIGGTVQAGGFTLKGATGVPISVTAPANVTITETAVGAATMTVGSFTFDGGAAGAGLSTNLASATQTGFRVGAVLTVGSSQTAGTYTGTVTLTANY